MYLGHDGRQYNSRFDAFGYDNITPDGLRGFREQELKRWHQEVQQSAMANRQQNQLTQQKIEAEQTQHFYDRWRQHDELINRQYGIGKPGIGQGVQQGKGHSDYGIPMGRKETVMDPLVQDAGRLHDMLNKEYRRQRGITESSAADPNDLYNAKATRGDDGFEEITRFIN